MSLRTGVTRSSQEKRGFATPATPSSEMTRRNFLAFTSIAAAWALLVPRSLFADSDGLVETARKQAATATITVQTLRGKVSVLMGAGGNIAVLPGPDGKLLIDAGYAGARPRISAALDRISSDPIKHLINSHWHFDHTDGNEWLHSAGATILAHENTRKHLSTTTRVKDWDFTFPPAPAGAIPTVLFKDERTVHLNGATIALKHYAPAHTDSDISIHFTDVEIFHVADTFWNGYYPFIDYSTGGSIDGMIRATEDNLAKVTNKTIVIPGHGAIGDKSQLTLYRDLLVTTRDKVATLKKQGKSLDEIVATKPTAAYDTNWGGGFMSPPKFIGLVFEGV
jgi:glyoxylase-like metal-dependent hydrolase (beta-lactamase superfamily II)